MSEDTPEQEIERTKSELEEILLRVDSLPILDSSTPDQILSYDEPGLPRRTDIGIRRP
jgi:hypothetical protein